MSKELNTELLASMIKSRRGDKGLRVVAQEIGDISAPTLSRIEQGKLPDVDTFIKVCKWLDETPETFIIKEDNQSLTSIGASNRDLIMTHLRADKELSPDTIKILENVIELAYQQVVADGKK